MDALGGDLAIPARLRSANDGAGEGRRAWLAALPRLVAEVSRRWDLTLGAPFEPGGSCSWVAPGVSGHPARQVALKITWSHAEARDEPQALQLLDGGCAVRLDEVLPITGDRLLIGTDSGTDANEVTAIAMLLERCRPGTPLADEPESEQHPVITNLLRGVWRTELPGDHPFRPLTEMADAWAAEAESGVSDHPELDAGLVRDGLALLRELPRTAPAETLLCTDLHAHNVLAAEREPWLLIDPKPYVGDPHYDVVQHLINCPSVRTDPIRLVEQVSELAELDSERVRQWLFARCVQESLGEVPPWRDYRAILERLGPAI